VGNLIFAPVLIGYVFAWATRLYGATAGLAAVAVVTSSPNVLAHAGLATSDMAAASTLLTCPHKLYHFLS
jgi:4-amino-4-deoxy-L-arabinose transferase-like glycosyltransferase